MNKVFTKGEVLKAVPDKLFKGKCDLYGFASVEVPDREGDIIRVKGIKMPESPVKVAPNHTYKPLEVLGVVKEWAVTSKSVKGRSVPALAFGFDWARGEGDQITPFAAQFKGLYDSGTLDSFSGGFDPNPEKVSVLKGGRYDIAECEIVELSACMIPVNPYATVMKALTEAVGDDFDKYAYLETRLIELQKTIDGACRLIELMPKAFTERFDTFESKYVDKADDAEPPVNRRTPQLDPSQLLKALESTLAKLK
jgi:hypothetical protein